ncbi:uncharacterized protein K02A2.6-like [Hydractinia symbiolongicarpus]|uniref:uncharacterized protein K02A2.6-like n=1 Tax=Hydractinia symbiolongicarpus TaxID=13093 RepID=UPI00254BCC26|nr:uncharacterized protein K02A2.6-like [Hydractinia symbiolongicarpus]
MLESTLPVAISKSDFKISSKEDKLLTELKDCIITGSFNGKFKKAAPWKPHLSIKDDVVMFKDRMVVPKKLRTRVLQLAHQGHQGIVRTKQRLHSKVWWPGMSKEAEEFVNTCHSCQVTEPLTPHTPLEMTTMPRKPWLLLGCDLCGPFPKGENLLVCIDYYSRYPEVEILHKVDTHAIAKKLRKMFYRYGSPEEIVTDNGPQFISAGFKRLMTEFNIKHQKVAPYHPQANDEVERFNRTLKKCIQTAVADGIDWQIALENFLLSYRSTPHATTGVAPAELLFGRPIRDKIPTNDTSHPDSTRSEMPTARQRSNAKLIRKIVPSHTASK